MKYYVRKDYKEHVKRTKYTVITNKVNGAENIQKIIWNIIKYERWEVGTPSLGSPLWQLKGFNKYFSGIGEMSPGIPGPANRCYPFIEKQRVTSN